MSDNPIFEASGGELVVRDRHRTEVWRGRIDGAGVRDALDLGETGDGIAVLDWSDRPPEVLDWHPFPNVVRVSAEGHAIWRAKPLRQDDGKSWTGAELQDGQLLARGWSWVCELDQESGQILQCEFTK